MLPKHRRVAPAVTGALLAFWAAVACNSPSPVSPRTDTAQTALDARDGTKPNIIEFDAWGAGTQAFQGTFAYANNAEGAITGFVTDNNYVSHGFLRTPEGHFLSFDPPGMGSSCGPGFGTLPFGITDQGTIAGEFFDGNCTAHGFVRSRDGSFTRVDFPGVTFPTEVGLINDGGTIAGGYGTGHGFVRSRQGKFTSFDPPGSINTFLCAITCLNPSGAIAGSYVDAGGVTHGFLREGDGKITTYDVPGEASFGGNNAINPEGDITGVFFDAQGDRHGYVRSHTGKFTVIDVPGAVAPGTTSESIDGAGVVIGWFFDATGAQHAFVRSAGGAYTKFDAPGAGTQGSQGQGTFPIDNQAGPYTVGYVTDGSNVSHGFVFTSAP